MFDKAMSRAAVLTIFALCGAGLATVAEGASSEKELAASLLAASGSGRGLWVVIGCKDGRLLAELVRGRDVLAHGLALSREDMAQARQYLQARKLYGQASVELYAGGPLPYADNLVNALVVQHPARLLKAGISLREMLRVVCPEGVLLLHADDKDLKDGLVQAGAKDLAAVKAVASWAKAIKPRPAEMDEWTHNRRYDASGTAVSKDTALGPVNGLRWLAGPYLPLGGVSFVGFRDSNKAMVSAGGRNFYVTTNDSANLNRTPPHRVAGQQEQPNLPKVEQWWRLVARDAYNGLRLWSRSLLEYAADPGVRAGRPGVKPGSPSAYAEALARTLLATRDRVYGVIYGRLVAIDARTGKIAKVYDAKLYQRRGSRPVYVFSPASLVRQDDTLFLVGGGSGLLRAIDAGTGDLRWKYQTSASDLAIDGDQVFLGTSRELVALDRKTGREKWKQDISSLKGGWYDRVLMYAKAGVVVLGYGNKSNRGGTRGHHVLSAADGRFLWTHKADSRKGDPHIARLADGLIWYNRRNPQVKSRRDPKATILEGRDPLTGQVKRRFISSRGSSLNIWGGICRAGRPMATERFLIGSRSICLVDVRQGKSYGFPGRHACAVGVLPANGLLYSLPQACKCTAGGVRGFLAAVSSVLPDEEKAKTAGPGRLVTGPSAGKVAVPEPAGDRQSEWPTFRHDPRRSAATKAQVPSDFKLLWETQVDEQEVTGARLREDWMINSLGGDRLTPPTVADGMVFVSAVESHQVIALDARTGRQRWRYTTGGRLDTPPTFYRGLCLAGSHDGWVYCLRARDGSLVWRFRAAPQERRIMTFGQLESVWPVVGGVLVNDGLACFIAGRNSRTDGGLYFYAADPLTGKIRATRKAIPWRAYENNILVGVGKTVLTPNGSLIFTPKGGRPGKDDFGYFFMAGRYGNTNRIFNRIWHWPAARRSHTAGGTRWGHPQTFWNVTGLLAIGVPDKKRAFAYAFPWTRESDVLEREGGDITAWEEDPSASIEGILKDIESRFPKAGHKSGKYSTPNVIKAALREAAKMKMKMKWRVKVPGPSQVESLILAGDVIFAGGPLNRLDRRRGGIVLAYSADDGKRLGELKLGAPPASEGLAAVEGRLYVATQDGKLLCFGK